MNELEENGNNSPPGTGGVARSDGVVDESNNSPPHLFIGIKGESFRPYYHPGPSGLPSCSSRGVVPPSPPIHSAWKRNELSGAGIGTACRWTSANSHAFAFRPEIRRSRTKRQCRIGRGGFDGRRSVKHY